MIKTNKIPSAARLAILGAVLATLGTMVSIALAQDAFSTVSKEARAFIENNRPMALDLHSIAEWEASSGSAGKPGEIPARTVLPC